MDLDPRIRRLFEDRNFAHLATLMKDGSPHVAPIWITIDGQCILLVKETSAVALANLRRDPRAAISITSVEDPYAGAYVRGRAVDFREGEVATELVHALAKQYTGAPYRDPDAALAMVVIEIERAALSRTIDLKHSPPAEAPQI